MADRPRVIMDPSETYRRLVSVDRLGPAITPSDDVYGIAHMGLARVDRTTWRVTGDGLVERAFGVDYGGVGRQAGRDVTPGPAGFGQPGSAGAARAAPSCSSAPVSAPRRATSGRKASSPEASRTSGAIATSRIWRSPARSSPTCWWPGR